MSFPNKSRPPSCFLLPCRGLGSVPHQHVGLPMVADMQTCQPKRTFFPGLISATVDGCNILHHLGYVYINSGINIRKLSMNWCRTLEASPVNYDTVDFDGFPHCHALPFFFQGRL